MIETTQDISELAKALPAAQAKFGRVSKDAANPHFGQRYATLAEIVAATLPALNDHGFSVVQAATVTAEGTAVEVTTRLMHTSAQWLQATHVVPITKRDPQGVGSALTYARRQAVAALLMVAPAGEDDDAEAAVGRGQGRPPLPPAPPPTKAPTHDRVERLQNTMREVTGKVDLQRAWRLGGPLLDELRKAQSHSVVTMLENLYAQRLKEISDAADNAADPVTGEVADGAK